MKKIVLYVFSILLGLFCLGGGTFLFTADTQLPQQEEEIEGASTMIFRRGSDSVGPSTVYVWNCTTGTKYSLSRSSSGSTSCTMTYYSGDVIAVYVALDGYSYKILMDKTAVGGSSSSESIEFTNEIYLETDEFNYTGGSIFFYVDSKSSDVTVTYNANGGSFSNSSYGNRVYSAGAYLFNFGGRKYYKKYSGYAYVGWGFRHGNWSWPVLVSTSSSAVAFYTDYNTSITISYRGSFSYGGTTYYYSSPEYEMQSSFDTAYKCTFI
ncbi:MAG: hypothetical protein J6J23_02090, partial [Clostridia bacterium]|nr:hypothetical protein [Clostridia bacterium]